MADLILTVQDAILKWQVEGPTVVTVPAISLEYVRIPVTAMVGGQSINPTSDTVQMAFLPTSTAQPASGDWKTASWDPAPTTGGKYLAQCLIGPGGTVTLTAATWWIWVKVTDNPEVPIRSAAFIIVI